MRLVPGIVFVDGPNGRQAHIEDSKLDVWEFIREYLICGNDRTSFNQTFADLSQEQLNAALKYYFAFPEEIDEILDQQPQIRAD